MSVRNSGDATRADATYYVALPFGVGDDGPEPREAIERFERAPIERAAPLKRHLPIIVVNDDVRSWIVRIPAPVKGTTDPLAWSTTYPCGRESEAIEEPHSGCPKAVQSN